MRFIAKCINDNLVDMYDDNSVWGEVDEPQGVCLKNYSTDNLWHGIGIKDKLFFKHVQNIPVSLNKFAWGRHRQ